MIYYYVNTLLCIYIVEYFVLIKDDHWQIGKHVGQVTSGGVVRFTTECVHFTI